jgi:hypothetical protein
MTDAEGMNIPFHLFIIEAYVFLNLTSSIHFKLAESRAFRRSLRE